MKKYSFSCNEKSVAVFLRDEYSEQALFNQIMRPDGAYSIAWLPSFAKLYNFYNSVKNSGKQPLIIDIGANIGLASLYFHCVYHEAKIVAIEPVKENFAMMKLNLDSDFEIDLYNNAISDQDFARVDLRNKLASPIAFQMIESTRGEIETISVNRILSNYHVDLFSPFIIKIDIEGYEKQLFSSNYDWLTLFPIVIVELHDRLFSGQGNSMSFLKAISNFNFDFYYYGENVFLINNDIVNCF